MKKALYIIGLTILILAGLAGAVVCHDADRGENANKNPKTGGQHE